MRLKKSLAATHSARFVWHVLRLPTAFYQQRYAGDIASRVDGNSAVADLVSGPLATTVVGMLMVVVYGARDVRLRSALGGGGRGAGRSTWLASRRRSASWPTRTSRSITSAVCSRDR